MKQRLLTWNGETHNLKEWAARTGIGLGTLWWRLKQGWSAERILTQPARVPIREHFWDTVDRNGSIPIHQPRLGRCWEWRASRDDGGYGVFRVGKGKGKLLRAHRMAWELTHGQIQGGLWVLHRCDNAKCCRPSHLFLGTVGDNNRDMYAKGRARSPNCLPRGSKHWKATITEEQARAIREAVGKQCVIAARFGVSKTIVSTIKTGRTWRHLQ